MYFIIILTIQLTIIAATPPLHLKYEYDTVVLPTHLIKSLLEGELNNCRCVILLHDNGFSNSEIDHLVSTVTLDYSRVISIGQLEPNSNNNWRPTDYAQNNPEQTVATTVRNIDNSNFKFDFGYDEPLTEMDNREDLSMPASKTQSQSEAIFVLIGRRYTFKPTNYFVPDFPMIGPTPDDPLSYLSERMLQLKIILQRRRHSYFVLWNRYRTEHSVLLHPAIYGLRYKLEMASSNTTKNKTFHHLNSLCFTCDNGAHAVQPLNIYREKPQLFSFINKLFPDFAVKYNGRKVIISTGYFEPYVVTNIINGKMQYTDGLFFKLIEEVAFQLQFKYELEVASAFGYKHRNGSFAGCIGEVYYGRADMVAVIARGYDTVQAIDMFQEGTYTSMSFVTGLPDIVLEWNTVLKPFTLTTWITLFLSILLLTMLLRLAVWIMKKPEFSHIWHIKKYSERHVMQFPSFSILNQLNRFPVIPAIRPIALCWMFFSLLIIVMFSSNLMAFFINPRKESTIDSLQELLEAHLTKGYRMGYVNYQGVGYGIFSRADSGTFRKVYGNWELYSNIVKCMEVASKSKHFGCITYTDGLLYVLNKFFVDNYGRRRLHLAETPFLPFSVAIGVRLGDPFGPKIGQVTQYAVQAGLLQHWRNRQYEQFFQQGLKLSIEQEKNGTLEHTSQGGPTPLGSRHLFGVFMMFGIAHVVCSGIFSLEHLYSRVSSCIKADIKY